MNHGFTSASFSSTLSGFRSIERWKVRHTMSELQKIVVVIDADNTQISKIADVLREISTHGRIVVKRAYGNWRKDTLKNWETEIKRLAIKAEQQFDYVSGKNATDMALVIDTIELLHTNIYDAFVIVSSDSDYTPLAIKLHESGVYVMGVGEKKTPVSFRNACDEFLFLENISTPIESPQAEPTPSPAIEEPEDIENSELITGKAPLSDCKPLVDDGSVPENKSVVDDQLDADSAPAVDIEQTVGSTEDTTARTAVDGTDSIDEIHALLRKAYDTYQDDDGYVNVATAGHFLKRTKPDFDCRTYGHTKLPQLLEVFPDKYEMKRYQGKGTVTIVAFRCLEQDK